MFGVINIYKPKGLTSHDVVNVVRKALGIRQVGHAGTLDPFAQGVLPVCVGKATRLIEYFDDDKEYIATIKFGSATDTYDIEGNITKQSNKTVKEKDILSSLLNFQGKIKQIPPIYSAIKVNGKKLYDYARNGEMCIINPREVSIYSTELLQFDEEKQIAKIRVNCSKGTYIRSIANELGETLGCYGYLAELERTKAGNYIVENSVELPVTIEENISQINKFTKYHILENAKNILENNIKNPISGISLPRIDINECEKEKIIHGNSISKNTTKLKSGDFLILIYNNYIIAIGQYNNTEIKVKKVFV